MKAEFYIKGTRVWFDDSDVVNPHCYIQSQEMNPNGVKPFLIYNIDSPVAVVFANCEEDAWDEAADRGKLKIWEITEEEADKRMEEFGEDSIQYLGNYAKPHRLSDYLTCFQIPNPPFSFAALVNAANAEKG